jgi:L-fuculose-phosphate aldolase
MAEKYVGRKFRTVYVEGEAVDNGLVRGFLEAGRALNSLGLTPENAGNFSVRVASGMLITVGGVNKGAMTEDDVVCVVDFDFECAKVLGRKEPSSEAPMHWLIYQSFPDVSAVIHVHDDLALGKERELKSLLGICSTESQASYGTQDQAYQVIDALEEGQYAIIKGHGIVVMGESLAECVGLIVGVHDLLVKGLV